MLGEVWRACGIDSILSISKMACMLNIMLTCPDDVNATYRSYAGGDHLEMLEKHGEQMC
jgi:hypothetical protein